MKILITTLIAVILLPIGATANAACEFREESVDPATGEQTLRTGWVKLTRRGIKSGLAHVSAMTTGERKQLGLKFDSEDYYLIPDIRSDDPNRRAIINAWRNEIRHDALVVPAGSTLRISFDDMTSLELLSVGDVTSQGRSIAPGAPVGGFAGGRNDTSNYQVNAEAEITYALDPESHKILTSKVATSMRLETRARYFTPGYWGKNAGQLIQDTMKCLQ